MPGIGIFVNPKDANNIDIFQHEFGHVLQARKWGYGYFYTTVASASLEAASKANNGTLGYPYMDTWTEYSANALSSFYFGNKYQSSSQYPVVPSSIHAGTWSPDSKGFSDFYLNKIIK